MRKILIILAIFVLSGCATRTVYVQQPPVSTVVVETAPQPVFYYEEVWVPGIWIDFHQSRHWSGGHFERHYRPQRRGHHR